MFEHMKKCRNRFVSHIVVHKTRHHGTPRNQISFTAHVFKDGIRLLPVPRFRIQADQGVQKHRVGFELRASQPVVDKLSQVEVPGSDAGLEEEGVGGEVRVRPKLCHEIEGGDCFAEMADINVADQTVAEKVKVGGFLGGAERRRWWEFGGSGKREAQAWHVCH
ncbi:hypothetical protein ACFX2J_045156 [Malus domestica]